MREPAHALANELDRGVHEDWDANCVFSHIFAWKHECLEHTDEEWRSGSCCRSGLRSFYGHFDTFFCCENYWNPLLRTKNSSWPNFLQPTEAYCSILKRFWAQHHFKQQFLIYDVSFDVKAILHHIDVLCKHRSCVTASLQTLTFSCLFPRSSTSRHFCLLSKVIGLYHRKVSSHSNPL